jgi:hypothetical protein
VSPVILQMQKISFNQYDYHILPEVGPVQQHIPDYLASEECKVALGLDWTIEEDDAGERGTENQR